MALFRNVAQSVLRQQVRKFKIIFGFMKFSPFSLVLFEIRSKIFRVDNLGWIKI